MIAYCMLDVTWSLDTNMTGYNQKPFVSDFIKNRILCIAEAHTLMVVKVSVEVIYGIVVEDKFSGSASYSTLVLYIRDHAVLGFLAQKYHPKTSLKCSS